MSVFWNTQAPQPVQPPSLDDLLEDAKHVVSHGVRDGVLRDEHPLFAAIGAAEAEKQSPGGLAWNSPAVADLHKALGSAVQAIRPVTLHHLRSGWRIDGRPKGGWSGKALKCVVLVFATGMMFVCANLTMWHQRGVGLLEEVAKNKLEQQYAALEEFVFLVGSLDDSEGADKIMEPSSAVRTALRKKYATLLALETGILEDRAALEGLRDDYILGRIGDAGVRTWQAGWSMAGEWSKQRNKGSTVAGAASAGPLVVEPAVLVEPAADGKVAPATMPDSEACGTWPTWQREGVSDAALSDLELFGRVVEHDHSYTGWIRCKTHLKLASELLSVPLGAELLDPSDLREVRMTLDGVGTWWLPTLYGALGALIYHLRAYLSNTRPDPSFLPLVMRVCLGGFAGVAVAWFWQPDNGAFAGIPIGMSTLTLAFLMGFAIDVFLSFLDRLVTLMQRWVGNLGEARS